MNNNNISNISYSYKDDLDTANSLLSPQEILTLQSLLLPSMSMMDLLQISLVQMKVIHLPLLVVIFFVW